MIKKYLFYILLLITLNGCIQSSVSFIGPAYTVASTGNIYQAGLSISVNQALLHTTGENTLEYANRIIRDLENYKEKKINKQNSWWWTSRSSFVSSTHEYDESENRRAEASAN